MRIVSALAVEVAASAADVAALLSEVDALFVATLALVPAQFEELLDFVDERLYDYQVCSGWACRTYRNPMY